MPSPYPTTPKRVTLSKDMAKPLRASLGRYAEKVVHSVSNKLRAVYLPFILIAVGCLVGYSFLNWLLLIKLDFFTLNEKVVNLWLPIFPGSRF
jgi:hypothetical protein